MDNLKLKALEYFAAKPLSDKKAKKFLMNTYNEIHKILVDADSYDSLLSAFEVLEKFISHVADEAITDLVFCWNELHRGRALGLSDSSLGKYHTNENLYAKIINLLGTIRYLEQEKIVPILFGFWEADGSTRKEVEKVFNDLAEFNLYAVEQIGFAPQLKLLNVIVSWSDEDRLKFSPIVIAAFEKFLATDIEGHSWDYRKVSIRSMAIPASEDIKKLRSHTVASLIGMYRTTANIEVKKELLNTMNNACRIWSRAQVSDEAKLLVDASTVDVLRFWESIVTTEPLELIQKIEHDAYWTYYHASSQQVQKVALCVETTIKSNQEYQVYRDLVGFDGVFGDWEKEHGLRDDYDKQRDFRENRVKAHLENVNEENLQEWLSRVENYLQTDSKDLATFPELFKFMEVVSSRFPKEVLSRFEETSALNESAIPIFKGVWNTSVKEEFVDRILKWIDDSKYLRELSVAFISFDKVSYPLMEKFVGKAIAVKDSQSLSSFIRVFDEHRENLSVDFINKIFEKIFSFFNIDKSTIWINYFCFSRKSQTFMTLLSKSNVEVLVSNLVYVNNVDHHVEAVLEHLSQNNVVDIFYFFEKRIEYKKQRDSGLCDRYEDIPFRLYSLNKVLAGNPQGLIELIKNNYEYDYGVYKYGVASLFRKCFFIFESQLIDLILAHLNPSIEVEFNLILAIVSDYEGQQSILPLVKRLLKEMEYDEVVANRINSSLICTGVVHGEYGVADAYKRKLEDISFWLEDDHVNVVKFAHQYCGRLKEMIKRETEKVDEQVAIEQHKYGLDESD